MQVRGWIAVGAAIAVALCGGLGYAAVSKPWWDEEKELTRIFAGSPIRLSNNAARGGNLVCVDACPSTDAGITADPNTYQNFITELAAVLTSHGYTLANNFRYVSGSGQVTTAPIVCRAPNNGISGSNIYWECRFSAGGPKYHLWGTMEGSPTTTPSPTYRQIPDTIADHLPDDTQLIHTGVEIERNH